MLERTDGNQMKAAAMLGINRNTLRKKITELKHPEGATGSRSCAERHARSGLYPIVDHTRHRPFTTSTWPRRSSRGGARFFSCA